MMLCFSSCRGVVHRDLKLENLLLATPQDITKVKIADFGLAKKAQESQMETICGTPQYVAPEVIQVQPFPLAPFSVQRTYSFEASLIASDSFSHKMKAEGQPP